MSTPSIGQRLVRRLRGGGLRWLTGALLDRIVPARPTVRATALAATVSCTGLEIGGPSRVFGARGMLPVYPQAARIDNVNFAPETAWETSLRDGAAFPFDPRRPAGTQWLREAIALTGIADGSYDFLLSSHCLEHVANPMRALREWRRVVRPGGHLLLVLPDPTRTFDRRRSITTLAHLREDDTRSTTEDDATHFPDVLTRHDLSLDPGVGSHEELTQRVASNANNRCVHHHVFDLELLATVLTETGWRVLATERARPIHLIGFAQKPVA